MDGTLLSHSGFRFDMPGWSLEPAAGLCLGRAEAVSVSHAGVTEISPGVTS